jgi:hypothetical protein
MAVVASPYGDIRMKDVHCSQVYSHGHVYEMVMDNLSRLQVAFVNAITDPTGSEGGVSVGCKASTDSLANSLVATFKPSHILLESTRFTYQESSTSSPLLTISSSSGACLSTSLSVDGALRPAGGVLFPCPSAATLDTYAERTSTLTFDSGASVAATVTRVGRVVVITVPPISLASETSSHLTTSSMLPEDYRPVVPTGHMIWISSRDAPGTLSILASGALDLVLHASGSSIEIDTATTLVYHAAA